MEYHFSLITSGDPKTIKGNNLLIAGASLKTRKMTHNEKYILTMHLKI
jgi:hypothetical protein